MLTSRKDELRSKRDAARTGLDETTHARKKELQDEMNKLKEKQAGDKKSRGTQLDKIKAIEGQMRTRISELNNSKTGVQFKSSEEIDRRIKDIESEVDSGKLKLVDEKKKLAEVSNLRRIKKIFPEFDAKQKDIDRLKAQISELKGEMSKSGNKEEDDQYTKIKTELDAIFSQERQGRSDFKSVGDEWRAADQELTTLITKLKALGDDYYSKRREHRAYEAQAVKVRRERERAERDAERQERHRRILQQRVDEASVKAYLDEIRAGTSLLRLLDPESANLEVPKEQSKFAAQAQRTVNEDGFKGARVVKKEEEDYFAPTGGKKGRKAKSQRKEGAEGKALGRFFDPQVTEQFGLVGLAPPSTSEEIAGVVEKVKEKIAFWKGDQDRKTEEVSETSPLHIRWPTRY